MYKSAWKSNCSKFLLFVYFMTQYTRFEHWTSYRTKWYVRAQHVHVHARTGSYIVTLHLLIPYSIIFWSNATELALHRSRVNAVSSTWSQWVSLQSNPRGEEGSREEIKRYVVYWLSKGDNVRLCGRGSVSRWVTILIDRYRAKDTSHVMQYRVRDTSRVVKYRVKDTSRVMKYRVKDTSHVMQYRVRDTSRVVKYRVKDTSRVVKYRAGDTSRVVQYRPSK
jgi:hypothetical protein